MKNKLLLVTLALAAFITPSIAQEVAVIPPPPEVVVVTPAIITQPDPRGKFYFGVKGGYNYSSVYDTKGERFNAKPKFGPTAGIFLSIPIGRFVGVQPEVLFSQRGFKGTGTLLGDSYKITRTTSYLDFPMLLSLKPSRFISLLVGPQFSYLIKQKDVFNNTGVTVQQQEEFKNANIRKNTLCMLTGFDINLGPVVLGSRAGWDLQRNNGDGTSTTPRYKNIWIQATLGLRI